MSTALTLCCGTQLLSFKRDTYTATFHSCEFILMTFMEAVQASVSHTKMSVSSDQRRDKSSVPILLQVPSSQGGLCFSNEKEELGTFTTLFASSHAVNRQPPSTSLSSWWLPCLSPPEVPTESQTYITCEEYC